MKACIGISWSFLESLSLHVFIQSTQLIASSWCHSCHYWFWYNARAGLIDRGQKVGQNANVSMLPKLNRFALSRITTTNKEIGINLLLYRKTSQMHVCLFSFRILWMLVFYVFSQMRADLIYAKNAFKSVKSLIIWTRKHCDKIYVKLLKIVTFYFDNTFFLWCTCYKNKKSVAESYVVHHFIQNILFPCLIHFNTFEYHFKQFQFSKSLL